MPFTFSHPAIVLPLYKASGNRLSLTGMVIGSITPDFEYFLRMNLKSSVSHTWPGLFWFDVPLGLLLTFLFHLVVRNRLYDNLPILLKRRVFEFKTFNWKSHFRQHWPMVIFSVWLGAFSHLFWDGFTHLHGYFVEHFPKMEMPVRLLSIELPLYRVLQHISTIVGGIVVGIYILRMPTSAGDTNPGNWKYWGLVSMITLLVVILKYSFGLEQNLIRQATVTLISAVLCALIITPFFLTEKTDA